MSALSFPRGRSLALCGGMCHRARSLSHCRVLVVEEVIRSLLFFGFCPLSIRLDCSPSRRCLPFGLCRDFLCHHCGFFWADVLACDSAQDIVDFVRVCSRSPSAFPRPRLSDGHFRVTRVGNGFWADVLACDSAQHIVDMFFGCVLTHP